MSGKRRKHRRTPLPRPEDLLTKEGRAELHKFLQQYTHELGPVFSEFGIGPAQGMALFELNRIYYALDDILNILDELADRS